MGLDMYLTGKKGLSTWGDDVRMEDDLPVEGIELRLGYWRKHADLHGYIIKVFAPKDEATGVPIDDCSEIDLSQDQLMLLLKAVEEGKHMVETTEGFFFGASDKDMDGDEQKETVAMLKKAIEWIADKPKDKGDRYYEWRSVYYRASW